MVKKILIGVGALCFILVNAGVSVMANRMFAPPPEMNANAEMTPEAAMPVEVFYYNVQPEFVVNFQDKKRAQFLMIELAVATLDEEAIAIMDDHDPELRNALLMLFSEQDSDALITSSGKEALRIAAKLVIDEIVTRYHKPEVVNDVFITRLVIQ